MVTRRQTMFGLAGLIAAPAVITDAISKETAQPFSWEGLQARALQLSRQPWRAPKVGSALLDKMTRSEEHTSELQSLMRNSYPVFCLKTKTYKTTSATKTTKLQYLQ